MSVIKALAPMCGLFAAALVGPAFGQGPTAPGAWVEGLPASDALGADDLWLNPTFRGGVVNGGASAHSNW